MITSDAFLEAEVHKWASLENTLVAPARIGPSFGVIGYIPVFLIFCTFITGIGVWPRRKMAFL